MKVLRDHVPLPDDQVDLIAASLERQRLNPVPEAAKQKYNSTPSKYWNDFYASNSNNFFRDRKWLPLEFPDLLAATEAEAGEKVVVEIGCGAGNAVFPLLASNQNPLLHLVACDYAPKAVKVVQQNPLYLNPPIGKITASVWDLTSPESLPNGVTPGSVDIVVLIFVLSALNPSEWNAALSNIYTMLKPNGLVLLRDYGRHDLTQLRFKDHRLLDENFYIRGDGTRVYFFHIDDLARLFTGSNCHSDQVLVTESAEAESDDGCFLPVSQTQTPEETCTALDPYPPDSGTDPAPASEVTITLAGIPVRISHPLFAISQLGVDRRLLVNRKRQLKMYRVWMQGQFRKIERSGEKVGGEQ